MRSDIPVSPGQSVGQYTILGYSASSGNSTGPHLHFSFEECSGYISRPGSFVEGNPQTDTYVTSQNFLPSAPPAGSGGPYRLKGNSWFGRFSNTSGAAELGWAFAAPGDVPIVANWDLSDAETEPAVFRPSNATWYLRKSNTSGGGDGPTFSFGSPGDWPMLAQVDNDPELEPCVFRPTAATWYCRFSLSGGAAEFQFMFGNGIDQPLMADIDDDGQAEPIVFREGSGTWFFRRSNTSGAAEGSFSFGSPGDRAAIGQVDDDPQLEPCVRRAQRTYCRFSLSPGPGEFWFDFGDATDWLQFGNLDSDGQSEPVLGR